MSKRKHSYQMNNSCPKAKSLLAGTKSVTQQPYHIMVVEQYCTMKYQGNSYVSDILQRLFSTIQHVTLPVISYRL